MISIDQFLRLLVIPLTIVTYVFAARIAGDLEPPPPLAEQQAETSASAPLPAAWPAQPVLRHQVSAANHR